MTKSHLNRVIALGCIICGRSAVPHHPRAGENSGMGLKAPDEMAIPLCNDHHTDGGYGVAIHAGQEEFERRYGTEADLLIQVREELGEFDGA